MATTIDNADLEAICLALAEKRQVDLELSKRIEERANLVRKEIARRGITNVAVDLIREAREDG